MAFTFVSAAILLARWQGKDELVGILRWVNLPLGLGAAGYTAFLFGQCEGRDLWQSKLLLPHLLFQALLCGAAGLLAAWPLTRFAAESSVTKLVFILLASTGAHALFALYEAYGKHPTDNATQAAAFLTRVRLAGLPAFHVGLFLGTLVTAVLATTLPGLAWIPALTGLYLYKWAYVRAAQLPPLS
jgi:predicted membrane protein